MARLKRKFKCKSCQKIYYRRQDFCACGKYNSLEDITPGLTLAQKKTLANRRVRVRSKSAERRVAKTMALADGEDDTYEKVASKNGRVGFINNMQIDVISKSYVVEAKNRKLPVWLIKAWIQLLQKGKDYEKNTLLYLQPPNLPAEIPYLKTKMKSEFLHVLSESRHEELIKKEKALSMVLLFSNGSKEELTKALEEAKSILLTIPTEKDISKE